MINSYSSYHCSILKRVIRNSKATYYNNIITSVKNTSKTSWNIQRKEMVNWGVIKIFKLYLKSII